MGFYDEIARYYDYIFPADKEEVDFLSKISGEPPKDLLDIACGTGEYSIELARLGYNVAAIDLDLTMIQKLNEKAEKMNLNVKAFQENMLNLDNKLKYKFDMAFCIGNSLVHLNGEREIQIFLKKVRGMLKENGKILIQIINYDRILKNHVTSLSTIENQDKQLKFERSYRYEEKINKILFKTILKAEGKIIENEIALYPVLSDRLISLMEEAGFSNIQLYGDMEGRSYNKNDSYILVISAFKN